MHQQSSLMRKRQNYRRDLRRRQLHKIFQQHRSSWINYNNQTEEQYFYQENYRDYLSFILSYAGNDKVNFMLLPFVGYVYEEMVSGGATDECFLILEMLTEFQEIEIPQDGRFARVLVENVEKRSKEVLNIISNLVDNHRYSEILRDQLIEAGFLEICSQFILSQQEKLGLQNENISNLHYSFVCILCSFVKSHPTVAPELYGVLGRTLNELVSNFDEQYVVFMALDAISSSFKPQKQRAEFLFGTFEKLIIEKYVNFEQFASHFLLYCARSDIFIPNSVEYLLINSLSSANQSARSNCLSIFQYNIEHLEIYQRSIAYFQLKQLGLFDSLFNLLILNNPKTKLECLKCFYPLARELTNDTKDHQCCYRLVETIYNCLDCEDNEVKNISLQIMVIIVKTILEEQLDSPVYYKICLLNVKSKLVQLNQFDHLCETILAMLSQIQTE